MDNNYLLKIGQRIGDERRRHNMTQAELSVACGLTIKTISMLETGRRELKVDSLLKICECLGVSSDYILFGCSLDSDAEYYKEKLSNLKPEISRSIKNLLEALDGAE